MIGPPHEGGPQPPPATGASVAGMHIETTVEQAHAQILTVIGSISQYLPDPSRPLGFSIESAIEVTKEHAKETKELFVAGKQLIDEALAVLEKHHILLLSGNRGCGKATMAIYLAARLADQNHLHNTVVVDPLDQKVEIDLWKLATSDKQFAKRTTVFVDAFDLRNSDLLGVFSRSDSLKWERLTTRLRDHEAYLIFTTEPDAIAQFREQISGGISCRDVPPAAPDQVGQGLDVRVNWLEQRGLLTGEHIRQITENRSHLIGSLRTLPRVARFLEQFSAGDSDLDAALLRFNDIRFWFSKDLVADVDAWCLALTLALAQTVGPGSSIGWFEFERIRRAVTAQIKADRELFPRHHEPDGRTTGQLLSDETLLLRARVEVARVPSRLGDTVRFIDRSYAATIRQTLAENHRRVLTVLVPALRTIAEDERGPGSYAVRSLAAQMLGCIGELDPFSISIPLMQQDWVGSGDRTQRPFVGRLLQGARTTGNGGYRRAAIGAIDSLTVDTGDERKNSDRLLTAISAYSLIGERGGRETALAMKKLGAIALQRVAPTLADLHQVEQVAEKVDEQLSRTASERAAEDLLAHRFRLGTLANRLSAQHAPILLALKQAVVYLCLTTEPVEVLCLTREWISQGGGRTATLVALLFLHGGIAEDLAAASATATSLAGGERVHPIIRSLANSAGAVGKFAAFLADLHTSIDKSSSLPAELRRELKHRFAAQLTEWVRAAKGNPIQREALQALFVSLLDGRDEALRADTLALLGAEPFTHDEAMAEFAAEIRRNERTTTTAAT